MKTVVAVLLVGLLASAVVADAAGFHRKLAQRYNNNRWRDRNPDAQFARNQAAAINTQAAIRAAEQSGANPWVTRGAANVGSANAYLAAQGSNLVFGPNALIGGR